MISLYSLLYEGMATNVEGFWGDKGAGILLFAADTKKFLVLKRASWVNEPGTWGLAGGAIDDPKESPRSAAQREAQEELGSTDIQKLIPASVYTSPKGTFKFHNFIGVVPAEFSPNLDDEENDGFKWVSLEQLHKLPKKHFGLSGLLQNSESLLQKLTTPKELAKKKLSVKLKTKRL
jgi:8-oxo-dGTP pyrophosphatase MutT (NUDIX family)